VKVSKRNAVVYGVAVVFGFLCLMSLPSPFPEYFTPQISTVFTFGASVHVAKLNVTLPVEDIAINITGKPGAAVGTPLTVQVYVTGITNNSYYGVVGSANFWLIGSREYPTTYNAIGYPREGAINVTYDPKTLRLYGEGKVEYFMSGTLGVNATFYNMTVYWLPTKASYSQAVVLTAIPSVITISSAEVTSVAYANSVTIALAWLVAMLSTLILRKERSENQPKCNYPKPDSKEQPHEKVEQREKGKE
jgi:hypothetical protein